MFDEKQTAAVVGVCGGAGATRLTVEAAATLARTGRDVAVLDVAFATQGLAGYAPGELSPDATAVLADDHPLADALVDLPLDAPGEVALCPARAPFERVARAQTAGAARSLGDALATAADRFDAVLVDVPPVATNAAVVANRAGDDHPVGRADAAVPESDVVAAEDAPAVADPDAEFAPAVACATEALLGTSLSLGFPEEGLLERLP